MKKSRYSEAQILGFLRQQESGQGVAAICREAGISAPTFYAWKSKYGGLSPTEMQRVRQLETENARLKRIVADLTLDNVALKDVLAKKW